MASLHQFVLGFIVLIYVCQAKQFHGGHDHDHDDSREWESSYICKYLNGHLSDYLCPYGCCGDKCCKVPKPTEVLGQEPAGVLDHQGEDDDSSREDDDDNDHHRRDASRVALLAAVGVVSVLVIVVLATLLYFVFRRSRLRQARTACNTGFNPSAPTSGRVSQIYIDPASISSAPPAYEEIDGDKTKKTPSAKHVPSDQPPPYTANPIY